MGHCVNLMSVSSDGAASVQSDHLCDKRFSKDWNSIPGLQRLWCSVGLRRALFECSSKVDVIHSHSLWLMPNVYPAWAARAGGKPLLISPRGTLGEIPLGYSKWTKRAFWQWCQGNATRYAVCLHATSDQEYQEIRAFGLKQPVAVVPNGIDVPERVSQPRGGHRRLLFLGRLHPKKGIDLLLVSWKSIAQRHPDWELRIVGEGPDDYVRDLRRQCHQLELQRIEFVGPAFGLQKSIEYAAANVFVLPSRNENFGMTIAEALAHGIPVITTTGTPWARLVENRCGWWIPFDLAALEEALGQALAAPHEELKNMGERGRAWMQRDFSWSSIGGKMEAVYEWVVNGGMPPDTVRSG
jgi:glycosyltransferase involved in cell wall biosynthesis